MPRYANDPRVTRARFTSKCKGCKREIKRGEVIYYWPLTKSVYCECGAEDFQEAMATMAEEDRRDDLRLLP